MTKPFEKILLFSGGVDSYVAWHYLGKPQTLYFNADTRYTPNELEVIKKIMPNTIIEDVINFKSRESGEKAYVPFRNLHFALLANRWSDTIIIAGVKDDVVSDKNEDIFAEWSRMMSNMEEREIKVLSPFWDMSKAQVVAWYLYHGKDKAKMNLLNTISCYSRTEIYCGQCPACFRKWNAFWVNDLKMSFHNLELMEDYHRRAHVGTYYITERNETILEAVHEYGKSNFVGSGL